MKRSTALLLLTAVLLGAATLVVLHRPGESSSTGTTGDMLVSYDSAAVDKLVIQQPAGTITIEKEGNRWVLTGLARHPADLGIVSSAIGKGRSIQLKSVVSSNPTKRSIFQVDSGGTIVRVFEKGGERASFYVGKAGPSFNETYVRREGSNDVYLAEGLFNYQFARKASEWRDRSIYKSIPEAIRSATLHYGDTTIAIARTDTTWTVDGIPAADAPVRSFLASLGSLTADDFVDTVVTALPPLAAAIDVDGTTLRFFGGKDATRYLVQTTASTQQFTLQQWRAQQILKRKSDFPPR